ncbi:hypothetical protein LWI29_028932 [Acer saccharum]|uniref:Uncharacterized protein n=1 Tax=Acer saccharum TaxID=4024 RepID=A0AA39VP63_ACESA|nr:hypothetical protein LWI29_028932 [Acer saccharum]
MGSSMEQSSEDDSEISDSDMVEYEDKSYEKLKSGSCNVKNPDETFSCPYCPKKRKQDYLYNELFQHASGVGTSTSNKRSKKEKANHLALVKYLEKDVGSVASPSKPVKGDSSLNGCSHDEKLVWPWTGILVNIPTSRGDNGRSVGGSGSKLRDEFTMRGFNPKRVNPLWNYQGHSGTAIVEFNKDWPGLHNAMSFEKAFEADHHGKKDWYAPNKEKSGLYAWVARSDDYNLNNIVGENLRKLGDLKTISEMMEEETRKQHQLVSNLTNLIEVKNKHLEEMGKRCAETSISVENLMEEKEKLFQEYNEEIKKIQLSARDHFQRISNDHEKLKLQLESQKTELELRGVDLEKREARNENDRKTLAEEIEQIAVRNSSLQLASAEQQKADEDVMNLAEDHKREKEKLHDKILQLERQLDAKHNLELEIQTLKGTFNVMKHMGDGDGDDAEVLEKMDTILKDLREKEGELEDLDALNQTLVVKERKSNDELQEARKELVNALKDTSNRAHIGVKRMGELDSKPFLEAMKRKYNEEDAEDRASELCSLWDEHLKDPDWHPFKKVTVDEKDLEVVNDEDGRLQSLKMELGDEAYNAVTQALVEINEYNPIGARVERFEGNELLGYCLDGGWYDTGHMIRVDAKKHRFPVLKFYVQMGNHNYEEELKKERHLVTILEKELGYRNQQLSELGHMFNDTKETFLKLIAEQKFKDTRVMMLEQIYRDDIRSRDIRLFNLERMCYDGYAIARQLTSEKSKLQAEYTREIRKLQSINDKLKDDMNCQKKVLEQQAKELEECKAQNDLERTILMDDMEKLKGKLQNQKPAESDSNLNGQITALRDQLEEKTETLQYLESLNHTLTLKESMSNQELQDARKESITSLQNMLSSRTTLAIKRMGEVDRTSFLQACSLKFPDGDWEEISAKLCSSWEEYLKDPHWHPFKMVVYKGNLQEIIDDEDDKLKNLRNEYGEAVYEAVTNALLELNEYNPSGRLTSAKDGEPDIASLCCVTRSLYMESENMQRKLLIYR